MTTEEAIQHLRLASASVRIVKQRGIRPWSEEDGLEHEEFAILGWPTVQDFFSQKRGGWTCIDGFVTAEQALSFCKAWSLTVTRSDDEHMEEL